MKFRVKVLRTESTWIEVEAPNDAAAQRQAKAQLDVLVVLGVTEAPVSQPTGNTTPPAKFCG